MIGLTTISENGVRVFYNVLGLGEGPVRVGIRHWDTISRLMSIEWNNKSKTRTILYQIHQLMPGTGSEEWTA